MTKNIYFDYAATTPVDPDVLKAMKPYFSAKFGNPSSLHSFGQVAMAAIDESREKIAASIGANFHEIIFTGSATEANNLALRGIVKFFDRGQVALKNIPQARRAWSPPQGGATAPRGKKILPLEQNYSGSERQLPESYQKIFPLRIIVSQIEHESILETCRDLENEEIEIIYLPVNRQGFVDLKKLKESLNERTILVSIMHANNEIGTIQPITKISEIINNFKKEKLKQNTNQLIDQSTNYPLFHTDAVQAFQFLDYNINKLGVDLMTLSAHKIYGPKGIGALYARQLKPNTYNLNPIITGGDQEFGLRSGTENVPAIVGFAKAVELAVKNREKETKRIAELTNYFWKEIKKIYPSAQLNNNSILKQITLQNQNNPPPTGGFSSPSARQSRFAGTNLAAPAGCSSEQFILEYLPNILNIYFPNHNAQDLLMKLDLTGIAVSSGSACSTRSTQPSHVLKAIGLNEKRIKSSLRFSFGKFTNKKEINSAIKVMKNLI